MNRQKQKGKNKMKKLRKVLLVTGAAAIMMTGLAGCGSKADETSESTATVQTEADATEASETEATEATEATKSDAAAASSTENTAETLYPVEVIDSNGDVITIESEPEKVVSVAPNLTELMYELGAEDKLVGRSDYCDYPAEVVDIPSVGTIYEPNIETIIEMEPDVVIVSTHFDDDNTAKLTELGIPVVTLYEEENVEGVYDMITTLGTVINKNAEAAECVADMQATIADVEAAVDGLDEPTVYYVVGYGEYGDYTATGETFIAGMLDIAGGDNIAKDATGWSYSLESLIEADPDIIVISEYSKDDFMSQEAYSELSAVKNGNVYTLDTNMLDRQGYRNAEGILELAKIFHPEAF
jgi:iron complex transport system substrate-binding protein